MATFMAASAAAPREFSIGRHRIRLVDLNGDGVADIAEMELGNGEIWVLDLKPAPGKGVRRRF